MLHIEMYTGKESGKLSNNAIKYTDMLDEKLDNFSEGHSFKRRKDLFDLLDLLEKMLNNSKRENLIK